MHAKDVIRHSMGLGEFVLKSYLSDLADADLLIRPVEGMNHIAWQLGHLISTERRFVDQIQPGSCPPLPEGFDAAHDKTGAKVDDPGRFRTKDEYVALFQAQREATKAVLNALPDERLDEPGPAPYVPTVGAVFEMCGTHVVMHAGQFVAVRRRLGKPVTI